MQPDEYDCENQLIDYATAAAAKSLSKEGKYMYFKNSHKIEERRWQQTYVFDNSHQAPTFISNSDYQVKSERRHD